MNNYIESKKKLDALRNKNEMLFRMAISHLVDVGIRHLTEANIEDTCAAIMKEDDTHKFMTNKFQCDIVRTAGAIAQIDHIHVLTYISREVCYDVRDNGISYQRAIQLLDHCMEAIYEAHYEDCAETLDDLYSSGFDSEEIEALGYGFLLDVAEEEDE